MQDTNDNSSTQDFPQTPNNTQSNTPSNTQPTSSDEFDDSSSSDEELETQDKQTQNKPQYGCKHYERKCEMFTICCQKWFTCRHCHNEANSIGKTAHEVDRYKQIGKIRCLLCKTEQPISNECVNCKTKFARYFCSICNFWDDKEGKQIFHCDECNMCRIGKREHFYHCKTCGYCLSVELKDKHKCIEKAIHQNCPVCLEFLFTSTKSATVLKCGHTLHAHCQRMMLRKRNYNCPICSKVLFLFNSY